MTHIDKMKLRKIRNEPAKDIADFSSNLSISYSVELNTPEFKQWKQNAVAKLARQGKPFTLTSTINDVPVTVIGKRI